MAVRFSNLSGALLALTSLLAAPPLSAQNPTPTPASAPLWVARANPASAAIRDNFGQAMAGGDPAFDLNIDGSADLVVGAPNDDRLISSTQPLGSFALLDGKTGAEIPIVDLATSSSNPTRRYGEISNGRFGFSIDKRNDTGFFDLVIGAPGSTGGLPGSVHLSTVIPVGPFAYIPPSAFGSNGRVDGLHPSDQFGWSVAIGDFLAAPGSEIAVGAPQKIGAPTTSSDNRSGYVAILDFNGNILATVRGTGGGQPGDGFGYTLKNLRDRNGDGYDDLAIGAPFVNSAVGRVEIISFPPNPAPNGGYNSLSLRVINGPTSTALYNGSQFGAALEMVRATSSANPTELLLIGAPVGQLLQGPQQVGTVTAYDVANAQAPVWTISTGLSFDKFGSSIRAAGDLNLDGVEEFMVGAPGADNGGNNEAGTVVLYNGNTSPTGSILPPTIRFVADNASANENLGRSLLNVRRQTPNNGAVLDTVVAGGPMISGLTPGFTRTYQNITRPSTQRQLGAGCPRAGGTLDLELTVTGATVGNILTLVVRNAVPGQPVFLWGAYPQQSMAAYPQLNNRGCFAYLDPQVVQNTGASVIGVANAQGQFTHTVPVINDPAVIGATAHFQAYQVAPSSSGFSMNDVTSSNGVAVTAGGY